MPNGRSTILVAGAKSGLPYSKGLLASSILATGLSPATAYEIAGHVEDALYDGTRTRITADELRELTAAILREHLGDGAADRYLTWQRAQERQTPLIVLIGGATGTGKSTVATQIATRLGITRIVSTDAIREVMRSVISQELLPSLHVSSFEVSDVISAQVPPGTDPLLAGFLRQTAAVLVGVRHIIRRAIIEATDMIVEGVHLVPGAIPLPAPEDAVALHLLLRIDDVDTHRSHLELRGQDVRDRPQQRYLENFDRIRRLHEELVARAAAHEVSLVRSYALDQTVADVTALVVSAVTVRGADQEA